jgi:predicted helicase
MLGCSSNNRAASANARALVSHSVTTGAFLRSRPFRKNRLGKPPPYPLSTTGREVHVPLSRRRPTASHRLPVFLSWLGSSNLGQLDGIDTQPDEYGYWTERQLNEPGKFLPVASKSAKETKIVSQARAVFRTFALGVSTNRDEWVYDFNDAQLAAKARALVALYDAVPTDTDKYADEIKWSRNLKRRLSQRRRGPFSAEYIVNAMYRPFVRLWLHKSRLFVDELSISSEIFPNNRARNPTICFTDPHGQKPWLACAVDRVADLHFVGSGAGAICLPRYRFANGQRIDNIIDWALEQFESHYKGRNVAKRPITKNAIFDYVYGVLHDPAYREKYALKLKREFPPIPFYDDFWRWADWGKRLMPLHIGYETVEP